MPSRSPETLRSTILKWPKIFPDELDVPEDELRRQNFLNLVLLIMIPSILGLTLIDVLDGLWPDALRGGVVGILVTLLLFVEKRGPWIWLLVRAITFLATAIVFYETAGGGSDGLAFLWLYTLPMILFSLFGEREGALWLLVCLAFLCLLFFGDWGSQTYDLGLEIRFLLTFCLLSAIWGSFEVSRRRHYDALETETAALEKALDQVKRLRGILRICASCKKIRDDRGYWSRIEAYLEQHSEAEFSHALCPACHSRNAAAGWPEKPHAAS